MLGFLQEPEPGRVVVEAGETEKQDGNDPGRHRKQRPESHLRLEFALELLDLGVIELCRNRHADSANRAAIIWWRMPVTSAGQSPCRISPRQHAAGCRHPEAPSPFESLSLGVPSVHRDARLVAPECLGDLV